ncbi:MAG: insulinase family protein, partial [Methylobacterium sp.]|nr:insulinase family protein [Methylobacterium sp.]
MTVINLSRSLAAAAAGLLFTLQAFAALPIQHWQSPSGARVYFVENHDLPILDLNVSFAAGSSQDRPDKPGVAALTRSLMALGAGGLSDDEISTRFADLGAQLGGEYDADRAALELRTLSSERERTAALKLFASLLQQPDYPAAVLEREKARTVAGLREAQTQPESISSKALGKALYANHPYALDELVEPETVDKITREDLVAFHRGYYTRDNAVVAIIGDVTRAQAERIAEQMTAGLPLGSAAKALPPPALPAAAVERRIAHPAAQSHILMGYPGIKRGDPDYFPLYVGNYILGGGGFVSRLTEEVREKRGYAYSVYSYFAPLKQPGPFQIGLQTKRAQAADAERLAREILEDFVKN